MAYLIAAAVAVLVVAGVYLVGGWIWASGFKKSALTPQPTSRSYGVFVRVVTSNRVTLSSPEPRQDIGHPGRLGLYWEGGYGQITDVVDVEGTQITRGYEHLTGAPPKLGIEVDLEAYAFPSDPADVDLEFETASYQSELGPISAWVVPAASATRWAIHVHGWTAERREAIRLLRPIHRSSVTSMVIDYRNDPGAPRDPTGHYRFGLAEWHDVEGAVTYAIDHGATDVVLVGYSTGAAHAMSFLERSSLKDRVGGVVLDSPNIILAEAVRHGVRGMRFEPTPLPIGRLMTEFGMWIADLRFKIDWETTNYVQRAEAILTMPTLVFHGTSDQRIPISVSRQLEARASTVDLVETQAAGHVMSWNADPARYERYLENFLGRV